MANQFANIAEQINFFGNLVLIQLRQELARFRSARVREFVPVLAFRGARERLRDER